MSNRGGSRPGNPNGRRGGARESTRLDAKPRGPKPSLVARIHEVTTLVQTHARKFGQGELSDAAEAATALLSEIRALQVEVREWEGEVL